jgi:hypothetical protein
VNQLQCAHMAVAGVPEPHPAQHRL